MFRDMHTEMARKEKRFIKFHEILSSLLNKMVGVYQLPFILIKLFLFLFLIYTQYRL